eukprot:Hpha_TRINITY_DN11414_c0_g1::TRINITY_DN11414_c0_g1_i1::g.137422::m.137422
MGGVGAMAAFRFLFFVICIAALPPEVVSAGECPALLGECSVCEAAISRHCGGEAGRGSVECMTCARNVLTRDGVFRAECGSPADIWKACLSLQGGHLSKSDAWDA